MVDESSVGVAETLKVLEPGVKELIDLAVANRHHFSGEARLEFEKALTGLQTAQLAVQLLSSAYEVHVGA